MKPKWDKFTKLAWLQWLMLWLVGGVLFFNFHGGQDAALAFLMRAWADFVTWAGVTVFLCGLAMLTAILGSPVKPWRWFK